MRKHSSMSFLSMNYLDQWLWMKGGRTREDVKTDQEGHKYVLMGNGNGGEMR